MVARTVARIVVLGLILMHSNDCIASKPFRNGAVVYFQEEATLHSNGTECAAVKKGMIPNVVLQVGEMRTASTLQYATLLLIGQLICPGATIKHGFVHHSRNMLDVIQEQPNPNVLQIYKSHSFDHATQLPSNSWIFASVKDGANYSGELHGMSEAMQQKVLYWQNYSFVIHKGVGDLQVYRRIFLFAQFSASDLTEILNLWRTMRICCGSQLSSSWRRVLMHPAALYGPNRQKAWYAAMKVKNENVTMPRNHECKDIDFNSIERDLFSRLAKMDIPNSLLPFGTHAPIFPYIGWCECTVQLTHRFRLEMNSITYKQCERTQYNTLRKAPKNINSLISKFSRENEKANSD